MQASLQQRRAYSCWQCEPRFGFAVASQRLHAVNEGFALASQWHRSFFTNLSFGSASQWRHSVFTLCCKPRFGVAVASQWHRSIFTLAI